MEYFIDPKQAYSYLSNNFRLHKSTNGWYNFKCPFCNEIILREKIAINFDTLYVKCWVCAFRGFILDFIQEYEGVSRREAVDILRGCKPAIIKLDQIEENRFTISDVGLPETYCPIMEGEGILGVRARAYLRDRGFDLRIMDKLGIGYGQRSSSKISEDEDYFGYIIVPFKQRGKLQYFIGRDYIGNFLRYKNPPKELFNIGKGEIVFNSDALLVQDEVFIMEGWADACTVGSQGTSTQGWSMSKRQQSLYFNSNAEIFVFVPDAGEEAGVTFYERAVELAMDFLEIKTVFVLDLNREEGKDANSIGKKRILEIYKNTPRLTFERATEILMNYV